MKFIFAILGFLASAFGMAQAIVGFVIKGREYKKAHLFDDCFGFMHRTMIDAYARLTDRAHPKHGRTYHNLKNIWPTWLEISQERPSKAIAFLIILLISLLITAITF